MAICGGVADSLEVSRAGGEPIEITFDTRLSPPSFGDFFNVVMTARFLGSSGLQTTLRIRDTGLRHPDWADLTLAEQERHVADCEAMARLLLVSSANVDRTDRPLADEATQVPAPLESHADPAYMLTQTLFHVLIDIRNWEVPAGFLLTPSDFPPLTHRPEGPYISWHVRRGIWDKGRDTTSANVLADIQELRSSFPDHAIMLFSSPAGIDFATQQLSNNEFGMSGLIPQPVSGFAEVAPYVLSSDFYFQRRGGGLSQIPIFSSMPYLILNDHASYYYFRKGDRFVPWATHGQQYVIKRGVSSLRIRDVKET